MILVVPKEKNDARVSVTPDIAKLYVDLGLKVRIESNAGTLSGFSDEAYTAVGAEIAATKIFDNASIICCVNAPLAKDIKLFPKGSHLIGHLKATPALLKNLEAADVTAYALEKLPRITRAQSMDILSSQANLAGYRAVIEAAFEFTHAFPLMMTAAGKVSPARVLILGVGVAGLQAIATAKRLGAIVSAYDVRSSSKEQVESLNATFITVDAEESGDGTGGYAKEMSDAYKKAEAKKLLEVISTQDIVVTTAQIPGKKAPLLVTAKMVESMKRGSVIIDMAVETGGNCEGSKLNEIVLQNGVKIVGHANMPGRIPYNASLLYAKNLYTYIKTLFTIENKKIQPHLEDELIKATQITKGS